jgi:DNA-binding FadR family transcriptional regulator
MHKPNRQNLTYGIVEELGQAVVTGAYTEKDPFPIEAELCKQYGASRTATREAVKMLTAKGLLSARPRQGTKIEPEGRWNLLDPDVLRWILERKFSLELLAEFTEMRLAIEPMAATLAAHHATQDGLAQMHRAIERMKAASRGDDGLLHATGNRFYAQLEGLISAALRTSIRLTNRVKGVSLADVSAHKRVLDAIIAKNPRRASEGVVTMLQEVMDLINVARRMKSGTPSRSRRTLKTA